MITRRQFLRGSGLAAAATLAPFHLSGCRTSKPPHVIIITMDTVARKHFHAGTAPGIQAFLEGARRFHNTYSSGNQTMPVHASLFTGQYPHHHGVILQQPMPQTCRTLAAMLAEAGYATGAVTGASFLNQGTMGVGFTHFSTAANFERPAEETVNDAIAYVDAARQEPNPFHLWLHLWDPHHPYLPPEPHHDLTNGDAALVESITARFPKLFKKFEDLPHASTGTVLTPPEQAAVIARHHAEIRYMDQHLTRFFAHLKKTGLFDRSIIVLTADHGESLFENSDYIQAHNLIDQPVVEVPLYLWHPDIAAGDDARMTQIIDVAPTLLNMLGLRGQAGQLDGLDLLDTWDRDEIYLTQTGNQVFAVVNKAGKKLKKAMLPFEGRIAPPADWQLPANLPEIPINEDVEHLTFSSAPRGFSVSWQHPPNRAEIKRYGRQFATGDNTRNNLEGMIEMHEEGGRFVDASDTAPRVWSSVLGTRGKAPFRIIGLNASGEIVAASAVHYMGCSDEIGRECFDLAADPREQQNLSEQEPPWAAAMESKLALFAQGSAHLVDHTAAMEDDLREKLDAMNYL